MESIGCESRKAHVVWEQWRILTIRKQSNIGKKECSISILFQNFWATKPPTRTQCDVRKTPSQKTNARVPARQANCVDRWCFCGLLIISIEKAYVCLRMRERCAQRGRWWRLKWIEKTKLLSTCAATWAPTDCHTSPNFERETKRIGKKMAAAGETQRANDLRFKRGKLAANDRLHAQHEHLRAVDLFWTSGFFEILSGHK